MSLEGLRPQVTTSLSRKNFVPALGPRRTTTMAFPSSSSSMGTENSSSPSPSVSRLNVTVVSSPWSVRRGAPHVPQKFEPSGLRLPQLRQTMLVLALLRPPPTPAPLPPEGPGQSKPYLEGLAKLPPHGAPPAHPNTAEPLRSSPTRSAQDTAGGVPLPTQPQSRRSGRTLPRSRSFLAST